MNSTETLTTTHADDLLVGDVIILWKSRHQIAGFEPSTHPVCGGHRAAVLPTYSRGRLHLGENDRFRRVVPPGELRFYVHIEISPGVERQASCMLRTREYAEKLAKTWAEETGCATHVSESPKVTITLEEHDQLWPITT